MAKKLGQNRLSYQHFFVVFWSRGLCWSTLLFCSLTSDLQSIAFKTIKQLQYVVHFFLFVIANKNIPNLSSYVNPTKHFTILKTHNLSINASELNNKICRSADFGALKLSKCSVRYDCSHEQFLPRANPVFVTIIYFFFCLKYNSWIIICHVLLNCGLDYYYIVGQNTRNKAAAQLSFRKTWLVLLCLIPVTATAPVCFIIWIIHIKQFAANKCSMISCQR